MNMPALVTTILRALRRGTHPVRIGVAGSIFALLLPLSARADVFNQNTGDVMGNQLAAAAAATYLSPDLTNQFGHSVKCLVSITKLGASATLTVTIQGKDTASGRYYTLLASTALNSVSDTVLTVGPGLTAATNTIVNDVLPATWNVKAVVGTAAVTATIGCSTIE